MAANANQSVEEDACREFRSISIGLLPPGSLNAITDVTGVLVGHASIRGARLRTGITAVLPHSRNLCREKITAAGAVLNGYGKSIGLMQIEELGTVETSILLTSTLNVPRVADALISYMIEQELRRSIPRDPDLCRKDAWERGRGCGVRDSSQAWGRRREGLTRPDIRWASWPCQILASRAIW